MQRKLSVVCAGMACVLSLLAGCGDSQPEPVTRPTDIKVAPDLSKPAADYVAMGIPATTSKWSIVEIEKAAKAIEKIAATKAHELPRYKSPKSGSLFDHILAAHDLAGLDDESIALRYKVLATYETFLAYGSMKIFYDKVTSDGLSFDAEVVEMAGMTLKTYAKYWTYAKPFAASVATDDPQRADKLALLVEAKGNLGKAVSGILDCYKAAFQKQYRASELTRLAGYMAEYLPGVWEDLDENMQTKVKKLLKVNIDFEADAALKAALQKALDAVE